MLLACYVDNCWLAQPEQSVVEAFLSELQKHFDIIDEGRLNDFLGVNITKHADGSVELTQPRLIEQILRDLNLQDNTKVKNTPGWAGHVLQHDKSSPPHKADWHYCSVIGKMNYLEKSTRPEIAYAVHPCARFSVDPREVHMEPVV